MFEDKLKGGEQGNLEHQFECSNTSMEEGRGEKPKGAKNHAQSKE